MRMTPIRVAAIGVFAAYAGTAIAQNDKGPPVLAKELAPARAGTKLQVSSDAFRSGDALDERYTQNGENTSPPIRWTRGPAGTVSYTIILEDAGVERQAPVTHWIVYDVPVTILRIGEHQPAQEKIEAGALQGLNERETIGFLGPKPPAGQTHPYHFQVFALNTRLRFDPAKADREDVVQAMKGHVLALGDLVVTYTGK